MWQLIKEFNRQGVPISASGVHSPALILVTTSGGQRVGFISEEETVNELPGSQYIEWMGDKYVVYPADSNATVSIQGTGEGMASLTLIEGQSGKEISYDSISVDEGTIAQLNLSDPQQALAVDYTGDGTMDESILPASVIQLQDQAPPSSPTVDETTPSHRKPFGICPGSMGLLAIPFMSIIFKHRRKQD